MEQQLSLLVGCDYREYWHFREVSSLKSVYLSLGTVQQVHLDLVIFIIIIQYTVKPPLTATSPQWPGFFVPIVHLSMLFTFIETSLQRPPLYNGQLIPPQGGRCREVQLYFNNNLETLWREFPIIYL